MGVQLSEDIVTHRRKFTDWSGFAECSRRQCRRILAAGPALSLPFIEQKPHIPLYGMGCSSILFCSPNAAAAPGPGMEQLRELGFRTAALALSDRSVSIDDPALTAEPKLAILLGTEGDGLAADTIASCDYTVKIPMSHGVDSLNVAAASAVAFWQLGRH